MLAQGVLHVHSAPPALCPHIEWAVAGILGVPVDLPWTGQPASPGSLRAELTWEGRPGSAGAITSALAGWNRLRFEVTEDATPGCDGVRHSYTPMAMAQTDSDLRREMDRLLGRSWDEELDAFRCGADGAPVRWLHATG